MKVAVVYDWVTTQYGGAEKVLLALHQAFPDAPLYTSVADLNQAAWARVFDIHTSWLQKIPWLNKHHRFLALLMPLAFESLDVSAYDVVISVTSSQAKGVITRSDQLHICYLLTPPRYLYSHADEYAEDHFSFPGLKWISQLPLAYLRWWDTVAAHRPDITIPISRLVADRCFDHYSIKTDEIIYPPVEKIATVNNQSDYYLVVSRLVPYKRIDLAIKACLEVGRKLVIIGDGPDRSRLEKIADGQDTVTFLGALPDEKLPKWFESAKGLLMPGIEDFGIVACEAVASGLPVVLHQDSGAAEIVTKRNGGVLLRSLSTSQVVSALHSLEEKKFNSVELQQSMRKYATTTFVKKWQRTVSRLWSLFQEKGLYER